MKTDTPPDQSTLPTQVAQLPFLLRLLDDDSPRVRQRVELRLREFGADLEEQVRALGLASHIELSPRQQAALDVLLAQTARTRNSGDALSWLLWRDEPDALRRLEIALNALSQWQDDNEYSRSSLTQILDNLTDEFRASGRPWHPETLSAWLFMDKALSGDTLDYYDPRNSNLVSVIESQRGNPISLTCVFMLVAHRLGLDVRGCNFPGHFLAHARVGSEDLLFDCFDSGRLLSPTETAAIRKAEPQLLQAPASPEAIIARVLRNLYVAYDHNGDFPKARFVRELLQHLETTT